MAQTRTEGTLNSHPHAQKPQRQDSVPQDNQKDQEGTWNNTQDVSVSVVEDADEPMETHRERSSTIEQEPQRFQPDDVYPIPRRKKKQDDEIRIERAADLSHERDFLLGEIRRLLKDTFSISQDTDFIVHQRRIVEMCTRTSMKMAQAPTPRIWPLISNMDLTLPGMRKFSIFLLEELKKRSVEEEWPFRRSDAYYKAILEERYKQMRMVWRAAQPKVTAKGCLETAEEVEERLIAKEKYLRRAKVLEQVIELKKDGEDDDLPAWQ
ncbi:hypothetical protein BDR07DRAFT_1376885 [Suillus spraguei]|nr:hypothetical protein BDR07DRAFT_1376885 [Suillus spraguei]